MKIEFSEGYKSLLSAVQKDEEKQAGFHDYRGKLAWIIDRVNHYAEKTGVDAIDLLTAWESARNYWYMNYYQDANQPLIEGDRVMVFDSVEDAKASMVSPEFLCPSCEGVSTNPYECTLDGCDWKSYGLFGTAGKGATVFIKDKMEVEQIFMPVAWAERTVTAGKLA